MARPFPRGFRKPHRHRQGALEARVAAPTAAELEALLGRIVTRIARHLERRGLLVRDAENGYLSAGPGAEDGLAALVGHSITYRIAVGPNEGRKAFTLQTLAPADAPASSPRTVRCARPLPRRGGGRRRGPASAVRPGDSGR